MGLGASQPSRALVHALKTSSARAFCHTALGAVPSQRHRRLIQLVDELVDDWSCDVRDRFVLFLEWSFDADMLPLLEQAFATGSIPVACTLARYVASKPARYTPLMRHTEALDQVRARLDHWWASEPVRGHATHQVYRALRVELEMLCAAMSAM